MRLSTDIRRFKDALAYLQQTRLARTDHVEAARVKRFIVLGHEQLVYLFQRPVHWALHEKFQQSKGKSVEDGKDYAAGSGVGCLGEDAVDLPYRIDYHLSRNLAQKSVTAPPQRLVHYLFLQRQGAFFDKVDRRRHRIVSLNDDSCPLICLIHGPSAFYWPAGAAPRCPHGRPQLVSDLGSRVGRRNGRNPPSLLPTSTGGRTFLDRTGALDPYSYIQTSRRIRRARRGYTSSSMRTGSCLIPPTGRNTMES